jgi:MFS family permease
LECHAAEVTASSIEQQFARNRVVARFLFRRICLFFAPMLRTLRKAEYAELNILFFVLAAAMGIWLVPLGTVLDAHGLHQIKAFAFAASALAAFVSPLIFGAMADRHVSPVKVLRGLALASAATMALVGAAIHSKLNPWLVLSLIQLYSLCAAPTWSICSTIVFARVEDAKKEFGPVRAMGTLGWMAGCWLVSALNADTSLLAGFSGAVVWLLVSAFTFFLPPLKMPPSVENLTWSERFGLDALALLKNRDHRVVFVTVALFSIPLAAFYPYAPTHMRDLGLTHTSAWMSLAQVSEIIAMFSLGALILKWRLKWIFLCGLGIGVLRFVLSALDTKGWLLLGVSLHGASFTLVFITAQIYLDQRLERAWRARAQALMTLMSNGVGNLIGYLGAGGWFIVCAGAHGTSWPLFWGGMAAIVVAVMIYFLRYHGDDGGRGRL